jgi:hypothetical protein
LFKGTPWAVPDSVTQIKVSIVCMDRLAST